MITRVFTLEIVCEGEAFYDMDGEYEPWPEISSILATLSSHASCTGSDLCDSEGNLIGYTIMHEI